METIAGVGNNAIINMIAVSTLPIRNGNSASRAIKNARSVM
jgi:hypothetical protein